MCIPSLLMCIPLLPADTCPSRVAMARAVTASLSKTGKFLASNLKYSPFKSHEEIIIRIDSLLPSGQGNGIYQHVTGEWKIRAFGVLPGELVKVKVFGSSEPQVIETKLISVIESSPYRVESQCRYFMECSGCQFQHSHIDYQREWKRKIVQECFDQVELEVLTKPLIGNDTIYGYRTKITPTYFGATNPDHPFTIGFMNNLTRKPYDIERCAIATDLVNLKYSEYRRELQQLHTKQPWKKWLPILLRQSDGPPPSVETHHKSIVTQYVSNLKIQFMANDFFQINSSILPSFFQYISEEARGDQIEYLIDTYCGCGVFSILLSSHFKSILGIDVNSSSIAAARKNLELNSIENVFFDCASSELIFSHPNLSKFDPTRTVLLIDPSRQGCGSDFLSSVIQYRPKKIVYIACDSHTQSRDCSRIVSEGGYRIRSCQPFDMFPQTKHIENIVTLIRD